MKMERDFMRLCRVALVLVVASGVCLAQEELVTVVRSARGDRITLTIDNGTCKNGGCLVSTPTYLVQDGDCISDDSLQRSKILSVPHRLQLTSL